VRIESRSPQDPGDVVVSAPAADERAVADVFTRARPSAREWAAASAVVRADALSAAAEALAAAQDELTALTIREVGKPLVEARGEVQRGVRILRYQAQAALDPDGETYPTAPPSDPAAILMSRRRPRGIAGLITPWNFPVAIPLWKAAPALAYGNAVVLKPSSEAVAVALRLQEILSPFLPEGVFTVVPGGGETARHIIAAADVVSFTGSTAVGFSVAAAAAERGIPAQCEMGGMNASIVLRDADLETAAATISGAAMGYAGQKCTATSRVIVVGDPGAFSEALIAAVENLTIGDPADGSTVVGPVINEGARDDVVSAAQTAAGGDGRVITGGGAADRDGWFVRPTLVSGQAPDAPLAQEEVFGPIATILRAETAEQAVAVSNGVPYGLVTSVFTRDVDAALRISDQLDTGMVRVNLPTSGVDFHAPFGGEKQSSIGPREQGKTAREFYTTTHTITIAPSS
jgi:aldehyde dehydrogenase (NAD+)